MKSTGYFIYLLKTVEATAGALLLSNRLVALALVVLAPVSINILAYHAAIEPYILPMAARMAAVHLFLGWRYRQAHRTMMKIRATA